MGTGNGELISSPHFPAWLHLPTNLALEFHFSANVSANNLNSDIKMFVRVKHLHLESHLCPLTSLYLSQMFTSVPFLSFLVPCAVI